MKICIDPGHGMGNVRAGVFDPGAVAGSNTEADIALMFGLTLKHILVNAGIPVFMTRDDATDVTPVGRRDDRAELAECTHFISIHLNSAGATATGTEILFRDDADKEFAQRMLPHLTAALGLRNRGVKHESVTRHGRLAVMDFNGPAVLIELGFISNPNDRARLLQRDTRIAFANAVLATLR